MEAVVPETQMLGTKRNNTSKTGTVFQNGEMLLVDCTTENGEKQIGDGDHFSEDDMEFVEVDQKDNGTSTSISAPSLAEVKAVLSRFINFIFKHPKVKCSSSYMQKLLRHEMEKFLLAHVTQEEDNFQFVRQVISTKNTAI